MQQLGPPRDPPLLFSCHLTPRPLTQGPDYNILGTFPAVCCGAVIAAALQVCVPLPLKVCRRCFITCLPCCSETSQTAFTLHDMCTHRTWPCSATC